jgi:holo-[acyl-carrier protein] synthase
MTFHAGIDLVDVADTREALTRFGDRYLNRIFTPAEIESCANGTDVRRLSACFAAKEAALKALVAPDEPIGWRSIEVQLPLRGRKTRLTLTGASADLATRKGLTHVSAEVASTKQHALAVVLMEGPGE